MFVQWYVCLALGIAISSNSLIGKLKICPTIFTSRYEQLDSSDSSSQSILELHLLANGIHSPEKRNELDYDHTTTSEKIKRIFNEDECSKRINGVNGLKIPNNIRLIKYR